LIHTLGAYRHDKVTCTYDIERNGTQRWTKPRKETERRLESRRNTSSVKPNDRDSFCLVDAECSCRQCINHSNIGLMQGHACLEAAREALLLSSELCDATRDPIKPRGKRAVGSARVVVTTSNHVR
jgi:hypothetical protein